MDSEAINTWLENEKMGENGCFNDDPDSLIPSFEKEVNDLGFRFETSNQGFKYVPRNKRIIGPIALKYYSLAKETGKANEQNYFMKFFCIRGYDEVVPMLLMDYRSDKTNDLTRWFISDCIYEIRSQIFLEDYLEIVTNTGYGINRQMFVLLLGKLKEEKAVPTLISLLDDEEVRLHALCALGGYKRDDFRCYFERFQDSTHPGWRKYARAALKKLDKT